MRRDAALGVCLFSHSLPPPHKGGVTYTCIFRKGAVPQKVKIRTNTAASLPVIYFPHTHLGCGLLCKIKLQILGNHLGNLTSKTNKQKTKNTQMYILPYVAYTQISLECHQFPFLVFVFKDSARS